METDLRVPVGLLFVILGLIMGIFGITSDPTLYGKSLGINVNLYWGIVELIFGSLMLVFGQAENRAGASAPQTPASPLVTSPPHSLPRAPRSKPPVARR